MLAAPVGMALGLDDCGVIQPTWTHEASAWVDGQLALRGWWRTGPLRVVRDSRRGQVVALPTTAGTMYVKRPSAFLAPEGTILSRLASAGSP